MRDAEQLGIAWIIYMGLRARAINCAAYIAWGGIFYNLRSNLRLFFELFLNYFNELLIAFFYFSHAIFSTAFYQQKLTNLLIE